MKLQKSQIGYVMIFVILSSVFFFQNCGQFKTAELLSNDLNSLSSREIIQIPVGSITSPDTGREATVVYLEDMVLPKEYVDSIASLSDTNAQVKLAANFGAGTLSTNLLKWPSTTIYFKRNSWSVFESEAQFRKVMDGILNGCQKWKAVANFNCVELTANQTPPNNEKIVWVNLAQVQTVNPQTGLPHFTANGLPGNFCGMIDDRIKNDGSVSPGTYNPFSCATVGYGIIDTATNDPKPHQTHFIAINPDPRHIDSEFVYVHEVGHLLGLSHTQNRLDRDNYITLNSDFPANFSRKNDYLKNDLLTGNGDSYDFASLMAYRAQNIRDSRFLNYGSNLSQLLQLVSLGAFNKSHPRYNDWVNLSSLVSAGAFAIKQDHFESGYALNQSGRLTGGAYPSPKDAAAAVELYGAASVSRASCQFNSTSIPHGTRIGVYASAQATSNGDYCEIEPRVCNNGVLSGNSNLVSCSARCTIAGQNLKIGESIQIYPAATVPAGQSCVARTEFCESGKLGKTTDGFTTCSVQAAPEPNCSTQLIGTSPVPSNGSITVRLSGCTNIPTGSRFSSTETKGANNRTENITLDSSGKYDAVTLNDAANKEGSYSRYFEVYSSSNVLLKRFTPVSFSLLAFNSGNPPSPTCSITLSSNSAIPSGGSLTIRIACSNIPAGGRVSSIETKGTVNNAADIQLNSNGIYETTIVNNNVNLAGTYSRTVEVYSSSNVKLTLSPAVQPVSYTFNTYSGGTPNAGCNINLVGTSPVPSGASIKVQGTCSNLPQGAAVMMNVERGMNKRTYAVNLNVNGFFEETINNNTTGIDGDYKRNLEIISGTNSLYKTGDVEYTLLPYSGGVPNVSCTYQLIGSNPIKAGDTAKESALCSNVPSGATAWLGSKKSNVTSYGAINLVGGSWLSEEFFNNDPSLEGTYERFIEIRSSSGTVLTSTPPYTVVVNKAASCDYVWEGNNPLVSGASGTQKITCSNLPTGAAVKLILQRNSDTSTTTPITLTNNSYSNVINNNVAGLGGTWVGYVEIFLSSGRSLFKSQNLSVIINEYVPQGGTINQCAQSECQYDGQPYNNSISCCYQLSCGYGGRGTCRKRADGIFYVEGLSCGANQSVIMCQ